MLDHPDNLQFLTHHKPHQDQYQGYIRRSHKIHLRIHMLLGQLQVYCSYMHFRLDNPQFLEHYKPRHHQYRRSQFLQDRYRSFVLQEFHSVEPKILSLPLSIFLLSLSL